MKTRIGLICAAALPALLLQGCAPHRDGDNRPPAVQVDTAETYGSGRTLEFPGRVKAAEEVNLAFQIPGTLLRVHAGQGTSVRQGELIAELDERDYRLRLEAVEAEYESIRAEAERVIALYADSVATPDAYDKARYGLRQIEAKYESCRNQLADTKIYAPFDGIVQRRLFDPPTVVAAGMPVVTLLSGSAPEIEINIPGSEYVRRGEFAAFEAAFDFWPGRRIPLRLLSVAPKANANQLYTVRNGPDARPGHEHDGQRLVPSCGHRTDERPGHGALPRGGRLLRLGLRSRQHRASPRGRRREPAHRRAGGPLVGTRRRGADRLLGRTPAA